MRAVLLLLMMGVVIAADAGRSWAIPGTQLALIVGADWNGERDHAGAALVLRSPLPANVDPAVQRAQGIIAVAVQAVKDEGPVSFAVRCRRDLERTAAGLKLDPPTDLVLGGYAWTKQPYRLQVGQFTFAQVAYTAVIGGSGICVTCSSSAEGFERWQTVFDAAITSLGRSRLTIDLK